MLQEATLLKHKILIGLLYGCGLRCMEVRNVRLGDLDFDPQTTTCSARQRQKDHYVPLSIHLNPRGLKPTKKPPVIDWKDNPWNRAGGDF